MVGYAVQLVFTLARARGRGRLGPLEESRVPMRVWPHDLDTNRHMNNGRYLTLMDFGRTDLVARSGLGALMLRPRWMPVVASQTIRYRRPLMPLQRFELVTRLVAWDERWLYLEQRFEAGGQLFAQAFVRAIFKSKEGTVPPARMMALAGHDAPSAPMPEAVRLWREAEELARQAA